jgi:acetylglutamate synthase
MKKREIKKATFENDFFITKLEKVADASRHKIIIPKYYIDTYGRNYVLECYKDMIIITPKANEEE